MFAIRTTVMVAGGFVALLAGFLVVSEPAHAGCAAGIPCIVNRTVPNPNTGPNAPKSNSASCDADFMNQIYSRAFMEGQRQNLLNETLIRKPDSVLEYTCFDALADDAAPKLGEIFSETDRWNNFTIPIDGSLYDVNVPDVTINVDMMLPTGGSRLENRIEEMVIDATLGYIDSNFSHSFLGGSGSDDFAAGELSCDNMESVWFLARCRDFAVDDQFLSFQALTSLDPRLLPQACTGGTQITTQHIDLSRNTNARFQYVAFDPDTPSYKNRLAFISPCLPPIPSGVMMTQTRRAISLFGTSSILDVTAYPDMICPNPSCRYECPGLSNTPPTPCNTTTNPGQCVPS